MNFIKKEHGESVELFKKMITSSLSMPINTILSLVYTRVLLQFLGETSYGVWITISSLAQWVLYFDIGIGNGMRNELTKEVSAKNYENAKRVTSTSYFIISIIAVIAFGVIVLLTCAVDTDSFFKGTNTKSIIILTSFFTCSNFVLSLCKSELFSHQRAEIVSFMNVLVHGLQLFGLIVTALFFQGSIIKVAIVTGVSSTIVNVAFSLWLWRKKDYCKPAYRYVDMQYSKRVGTLGIRFFILQIGCLMIYSTDNLIITGLFGPVEVTAYNTAYKVFSLLLTAFSAFISPIWSKVTLEASRKHYEYIKKIIKRLSLLVIPICGVIVILMVIFQDLSNWWLGKVLYYEKGLILSMGIFIALNIYSSIYSSILNGMGVLNVQLFVSVFIAILNIPLSIFLASFCGMGVTGVIVASNICLIISTLTVVFQTKFVLKKLTKVEN